MLTPSYLLIPRAVLLGLFLAVAALSAQPVLNERYEVDGVQVFPDLRYPDLHYYLPAAVRLAERPDGSPDFLLLRMVRLEEKTGTDQALLQFKLRRPRVDPKALRRGALRRHPHLRTLRPLPVTNFHLRLTDGRERIGTRGAPAGELPPTGNGAQQWYEQTFSVALSPEGSTLLLRQQEEQGELKLLIAYDVRADFVGQRPAVLRVTGNGKTPPELPATDTTLVNHSASAGAVIISVDLERWGERCLNELVVNYQQLPRYLPFSVSCYDFTAGLRPDLEAKYFRICGTGVSGKELCRDLEFSPASGGLESVTVRFPGPVRSDRPLRYRVTELTREGEELAGEWQTTRGGTHLDITTPLADRFVTHYAAEVYADPAYLVEQGFAAAVLEYQYQLLDEHHRLEVEVAATDATGYHAADFHYDNRQPLTIRRWLRRPDGTITEARAVDPGITFLNLNAQ